MEHNGYGVSVEVNFDDEAGLFHGDVTGIRDGITFQGDTVADLQAAFQDSVAEYLQFCAERGREPDQSFTGDAWHIVTADVQRAVAAAELEGRTRNDGSTETAERATTPAA